MVLPPSGPPSREAERSSGCPVRAPSREVEGEVGVKWGHWRGRPVKREGITGHSEGFACSCAALAEILHSLGANKCSLGSALDSKFQILLTISVLIWSAESL